MDVKLLQLTLDTDAQEIFSLFSNMNKNYKVISHDGHTQYNNTLRGKGLDMDINLKWK